MKNTFIEALNWRYATKKFDETKKVSEQDLETILEAGQLAATSYGLQPWKIFVVTNKAILEKIKAAAYSQGQVTEASHVLVITGKNEVTPEYISSYAKLVETTRGLPENALEAYKGMMLGGVGAKSPQDVIEWTSKQSYIVLGTLLAAAAVLKIDACPMEGFNNIQVDEILDLRKHGLHSVTLLPIGYRAADDKSASYKKVRFPKSDLITHID